MPNAGLRSPDNNSNANYKASSPDIHKAVAAETFLHRHARATSLHMFNPAHVPVVHPPVDGRTSRDPLLHCYYISVYHRGAGLHGGKVAFGSLHRYQLEFIAPVIFIPLFLNILPTKKFPLKYNKLSTFTSNRPNAPSSQQSTPTLSLCQVC